MISVGGSPGVLHRSPKLLACGGDSSRRAACSLIHAGPPSTSFSPRFWWCALYSSAVVVLGTSISICIDSRSSSSCSSSTKVAVHITVVLILAVAVAVV